MSGMPMFSQTWSGAAAAFLGMWMVMTVAMMLPSFPPVLWHYGRGAVGAGDTPRGVLAVLVTAGYLFVWTVLGIAAFPVSAALSPMQMDPSVSVRIGPIAVGVVVVAAGAWQLTARKARHLACCRQLARHARALPGDAGAAWRLGLHYGLHCSRCCANLMVVPLVMGVMDVRAMAAIGSVITVERFAPAGDRVARATGFVLIAGGVLLIARAFGVEG
ncbi:MAG: hypothetical protein JWM41_1987 [Gemmatimonadetes bacterium]|nr:hypothetical protein [Gemmatimonadota bacterium]